MHYCVAVITKDFPTDDVLSKVLAPYNEETFYAKYKEDEEIPSEDHPKFMWDWWCVGGRYGGMLKLKVNAKDEEYGWQFYCKEPRAGRLFRSDHIETCNKGLKGWGYHEEDCYSYMGFNEGYLIVDGCKVRDAVDFEETVVGNGFAFIGKNGEVFVREWWNGKTYVPDEHYEEEVKKAIADVQDCYICYVDIHD